MPVVLVEGIFLLPSIVESVCAPGSNLRRLCGQRSHLGGNSHQSGFAAPTRLQYNILTARV
jgi:hypothetical protein